MAQLDRVGEKAGQAIAMLQQVCELAGDAQALVKSASAGTAEDDAAVVLAQLEQVRSGAQKLINVLRTALEGVARIRGAFASTDPPNSGGSGGGGTDTSGRGGGGAGAGAGSRGGGLGKSHAWVAWARSQLPDYKTSGIWRDADGQSDVVQSGREADGEHDRINDHLAVQGVLWPGQKAEVTKHVEAKVAWRMRQSGINLVELVVNKEVCEGMLGCRATLPYILQPGQRLIVHDPVGSHVFQGRDAR
ncbi:DddA-like double-stranded DNA deaminase toxin [Nocardia sp. NRRL S-836]|uniref:DddA-like double-stranded DNA deaminase toxin n=1 Tax=Nocardia sp. NRRL S-836 TaxID=1519492 RepID=UPI0012F8D9FE|nr:DddA-like double-stranded DNA deaminase toxin [Nocardia sp. NRRL S-836]